MRLSKAGERNREKAGREEEGAELTHAMLTSASKKRCCPGIYIYATLPQ